MPQSAVQTKGGSREIVIRSNLFSYVSARSVNLGGNTGAPFFRPLDAEYEAAEIDVHGNLFYRSGDAAVAFSGCFGCTAAHNTFIDPAGHVIGIFDEHPDLAVGRANRFVNNLVTSADLRFDRYTVRGRGSNDDGFTWENNLVHLRSADGQSAPALYGAPPVSTLATVDPGFVDPAGGSYGLRPGSPALGAGLAIDGPFEDYGGIPYRTPLAVGAHTAAQ
jgi:hypothetical protein